jgi:DNA modification methylase
MPKNCWLMVTIGAAMSKPTGVIGRITNDHCRHAFRKSGLFRTVGSGRLVVTLTPFLIARQLWLREQIAKVNCSDANRAERDILARQIDCQIAEAYVQDRLRIIAECDECGITEMQYCATLGKGSSLKSMLRRIQLLKAGYDTYVQERRKVGNDGTYSLEYAVHLATHKSKTKSRSTRTSNAGGTFDERRHLILVGDALVVLRTLEAKSIQVVVTSFPYWPARRWYGPEGTLPSADDLGFEPTLDEFLAHLMLIFSEIKRVLRDDGVLFVVCDDTVSQFGKEYGVQRYDRGRAETKLADQITLRSQNTTYLLPKGNWLGAPEAFRQAMMKEAWLSRDIIIWSKGALGRKESTSSRCRHNYEFVLMFTKTSAYYYDQDALRIPLAGARGYTVPGVKLGILRSDSGRDYRIESNPMGRIADAVWEIPPEGWRGDHSAVFPEQLVRNCLLLTARPDCCVLDPFGGSGTVSAVALQMGLRSVYIDQSPVYAEEARQRLRTTNPDPGPANDNTAGSGNMAGKD